MSAAAGRGFRAAIVGGIVLIGAATLLWWAGADQRSADVAPVGGSQPRTTVEPAADYQAFAGRLAGASADVELVVEGLRRLAGALGALEGTPPEVAVDLRVAAEHLLLNPDALGTTEAVRDSLVAAAATLDRQGTGASPLRGLAESIDRETPLAKQQDQLLRYFVLAAERLRSLNGP